MGLLGCEACVFVDTCWICEGSRFDDGLHVIKDPKLDANYDNQLLIGHIYSKGMWLGVALRINTVKAFI